MSAVAYLALALASALIALGGLIVFEGAPISGGFVAAYGVVLALVGFALALLPTAPATEAHSS